MLALQQPSPPASHSNFSVLFFNCFLVVFLSMLLLSIFHLNPLSILRYPPSSCFLKPRQDYHMRLRTTRPQDTTVHSRAPTICTSTAAQKSSTRINMSPHLCARMDPVLRTPQVISSHGHGTSPPQTDAAADAQNQERYGRPNPTPLLRVQD